MAKPAFTIAEDKALRTKYENGATTVELAGEWLGIPRYGVLLTCR